MKRNAIFIIFFLLFVVVCSHKEEPQDVLIRVGDKYITVKEFRIRGDFTPHPSYPDVNRNLEKILLNNLIIEKLIAEERSENSELAKNVRFQDYIKGVAEQKMREQLFYKVAYNVVDLDSTELKKRFALSQREYDLEFYTIYKDSIAKAFDKKIKDNPNEAVNIFDNIWDNETRPTWQVKWKDPDHINIHEALYSGPLAQDSVIGPIPLEANKWILMKVVNWRDNLLLGGEDQMLRWNEVVEKTTMNKATRNWDAYIDDVMRGKQIQFDTETFVKLADLTRNLANADDTQEKQDVMRRFWQEEDSTLTIDDLPSEEAFLQHPFFSIDGEVWTVGDFRKAVASHPLVFRPNTGGPLHYYEKFRMAIADLVRDHYLNKEAYKLGLDDDRVVKETALMWEDALVSAYERDQIIKELGKAFPDTSDPYRKRNLEKAYDAYLNDLRERHESEIFIDYEKFKDVELSGVQFFVQQQQVPYPIAAPAWPMFSTNNKVEYNSTTE